MGRKIASEGDLRYYHNIVVENFVADIISVLANTVQSGDQLRLGQGMSFENHANTLSDRAEEEAQLFQLFLRNGREEVAAGLMILIDFLYWAC